MNATNPALIRSFTNTTENTVFVVQVNDKCSYFAAYRGAGKCLVFDSWGDADEIVGELTDDGFYAEVVGIEPGESLDLTSYATAWID